MTNSETIKIEGHNAVIYHTQSDFGSVSDFLIGLGVSSFNRESRKRHGYDANVFVVPLDDLETALQDHSALSEYIAKKLQLRLGSMTNYLDQFQLTNADLLSKNISLVEASYGVEITTVTLSSANAVNLKTDAEPITDALKESLSDSRMLVSSIEETASGKASVTYTMATDNLLKALDIKPDRVNYLPGREIE